MQGEKKRRVSERRNIQEWEGRRGANKRRSGAKIKK